MAERQKPPVEAPEQDEVLRLLEEMGVDTAAAVAKKKLSLEAATAERTTRLGAMQQTIETMRTREKAVGLAEQKLATARQTEDEATVAALEEKVHRIKELHSQALAQAAKEQQGVAEVEAVPGVMDQVMDEAKQENQERDPLGVYEKEVDLARQALDKALQELVDLYKEDNGWALTLSNETSGYSKEDGKLYERQYAVSNEIYRINGKLADKKWWRGSLENQLKELQAEQGLLENQRQEVRQRYDRIWKQGADARKMVEGAADRYLGASHDLVRQVRGLFQDKYGYRSEDRHAEEVANDISKTHPEFPAMLQRYGAWFDNNRMWKVYQERYPFMTHGSPARIDKFTGQNGLFESFGYRRAVGEEK